MAPSPRGDERAYYMYHARKVSPACASLLVNPVLLDVNAASFEWKKVGETFFDAIANLKDSPVVQLPSPMPASVSNLAPDGIYLLDTCFVTYVLIGEEADENNNNSNSNNSDGGLSDELRDKIYNGVQQLQLWSQVGREPKCLRPTASLPLIVVRKKTDVVQYQALLRWMVLDATTHNRDFESFCRSFSEEIRKKA